MSNYVELYEVERDIGLGYDCIAKYINLVKENSLQALLDRIYLRGENIDITFVFMSYYLFSDNESELEIATWALQRIDSLQPNFNPNIILPERDEDIMAYLHQRSKVYSSYGFDFAKPPEYIAEIRPNVPNVYCINLIYKCISDELDLISDVLNKDYNLLGSEYPLVETVKSTNAIAVIKAIEVCCIDCMPTYLNTLITISNMYKLNKKHVASIYFARIECTILNAMPSCVRSVEDLNIARFNYSRIRIANCKAVSIDLFTKQMLDKATYSSEYALILNLIDKHLIPQHNIALDLIATKVSIIYALKSKTGLLCLCLIAMGSIIGGTLGSVAMCASTVGFISLAWKKYLTLDLNEQILNYLKLKNLLKFYLTFDG